MQTSSAVSRLLTASVTAAVAASVASTAAGVAAAGTATAAAGGGIGAASGGLGGVGGGGGGGGVLPLILGAQRFGASSGLGVRPSEMQAGVADALQWMAGEMPILSTTAVTVPSVARRRLGHGNKTAADVAAGEAASGDACHMPAELVSLLNVAFTGVCGIAMTIAIQWFLVLLWRHVVNRRYYRAKRAEREEAAAATAAAEVEASSNSGSKASGGAQQPPPTTTTTTQPPTTKPTKPPKFFPFPKSLLWPTPLLFTCCLFLTGLTRNAVMLLAASPPGCGAPSVVLPIMTLLILFGSVLLFVLDVWMLHRRHGHLIAWKPAARHGTPDAVGDPWMRWRARASVRVMSVQIVAAERARERASSVAGSFSYWASSVPGSFSRRPSVRPARVLPADPLPTSDLPTSKSLLPSMPDSPLAATTAEVAPSDGFLSRPLLTETEEALPLGVPHGCTPPPVQNTPVIVLSRATPPPSPPPLPEALTSCGSAGVGEVSSTVTMLRAATRLQAARRAQVSRGELRRQRDARQQATEEERAARTLQGLFWRRRAEAHFAGIKEASLHSRRMAILQAHVRGHLERKRAGPSSGPPSSSASSLATAREEQKVAPAGSMVGLPMAADAPEAVQDEKDAVAASPADAPTASASDMQMTVMTVRPDALEDSLEGQPEAETSTLPLTTQTGRSAQRRGTRAVAAIDRPRRMSSAEARASALDRLASKGFRDRKSGAWSVAGPEEDGREPERTERILASPFAFFRSKPVDAFQSREGFFMFRVNGASFLGRWYRLLVIVANLCFGMLSGLQPLMVVGSAGAVAQTALVLTLQFGMAFVCFHFLPDADRIISRFAATQFLLEGLSTASLLAASVTETLGGAGSGDSGGEGAAGAAGAVGAVGAAGGPPPSAFGAPPLSPPPPSPPSPPSPMSPPYVLLGGSTGWDTLRDAGFWLALLAMFVPVFQLLEQRFITPGINLVKNRGGNPLVLLAAGYMLAVSLPKKVANMVSYWTGYDDLNAGDAAASATADAGDDAVEVEVRPGGEGEGDGEDCDCDCEEPEGHATDAQGGGEEGEACGPEEPSLLNADQVADAGVRASRLLARAMAAKEATGKVMAKAPSTKPDEATPLAMVPEEAAANLDPSLGGLRVAARLKAQREARKRAEAAVDEEGGAEDDAADD